MKNKFYLFLQFYLLPILVWGVTLALLVIFKSQLLFYISYVSFYILLVWYYIILMFYIRKFSKLGYKLDKKLSRINGSGEETLKEWLQELHGSRDLIDSIFGKNYSSEKVTDNLKNIKQLIQNKYRDIKDIKLLKAYFNVLEKDNSSQVYLKFIIALAIGGFIALLNNQNVIKKLTNTSIPGIAPEHDILIKIIFSVVLIICMIGFFIKELNNENKGIQLIKEILDICIEEKEEEKAKR